MSFDDVFRIMDESFPDNEMRSYHDQKKLLQNKRYQIYKEYDKTGDLIGFLAYWVLDNCVFFEHLAVQEQYRSHGLGKKILLKNLENIDVPVFLEVELPKNDMAKRRISFYERLGFKLNDFFYEQPSLRENEKPQQLLIMSYPEAFLEDAFEKFKKEIYTNVYNN